MESKDSPYYMGNRDTLPMVLETEYNDKLITIELPWDVSGDDLVYALYSALLAYFDRETILNIMKMFVSEDKSTTLAVVLKDDFRLTVKSDCKVFSITTKKYSSLYEVFNSFRSACVALTFHYDTVKDMLSDFLIEYCTNSNTEEEYEDQK